MRPVYESVFPWEEVGVTFVGDPHTFKVDALTEQLHDDLTEAKERGDRIVLWGDIAEWIVPSDYKRFTSGKHNRQVDAIVNQEINRLAEFYEPFADSIDIMKLGNHETEFIKRHHVDPLALLVSKLNGKRSPDLAPIFYGGYTMWWLVKFISETDGKRSRSSSVKFWLHHGAGGSAAVTRGAIDRARIYDAITSDVYVIGHKHQSMHIQTKHEFLDSYGNVRRHDRDFLIIPGYSGWEQEAPTEDGYILNWSSEKFYGLESTGCARMRLVPKTDKRGNIIDRYVERKSA